MKPPILAVSPDRRYQVSHRWSESGGRRLLYSETLFLFEEGRDRRVLEPLLNWAVICAAVSQDSALAAGLEPFPELYPYVDRLDETIAILDLHGDGEFIFLAREVEQRNAPSVRALSFSDDGTLLVAGGKHGVAIWDTTSRALVRVIAPAHDRLEHIDGVAISPDRGMIAFSTRTGSVAVCSSYGNRKPFVLVASGCAVDAMAFSEPGIVAINFADGSMRRWNAQSGRELSGASP
jgi:WD40 repeat protein